MTGRMVTSEHKGYLRSRALYSSRVSLLSMAIAQTVSSAYTPPSQMTCFLDRPCEPSLLIFPSSSIYCAFLLHFYCYIDLKIDNCISSDGSPKWTQIWVWCGKCKYNNRTKVMRAVLQEVKQHAGGGGGVKRSCRSHAK